ncbi:MAG: hypothetical protein OXH39_19835 [Candidatus Poribacteria bacterium]|nr:hypothetical protein [Candidatus Poribacteria bacterium]
MNENLDFSEKQKEFLRGLLTETFSPLERSVNTALYRYELVSEHVLNLERVINEAIKSIEDNLPATKEGKKQKLVSNKTRAVARESRERLQISVQA